MIIKKITNWSYLNSHKQIIFIILFGLLCRIIFTIFIAENYFGRSNIFVDGDTWAWLNSFINLIEYGSYAINLEHEYSYFFRMPGYSFFLGILYYLTGQNTVITFPIVAVIQIIADTICIWFVYKIASKLFNNEKISLISALLYSCYPFIIVWTPVAYSESLSIFFMLLSLYSFVFNHQFKYFITGAFISLALLFRPQIALLIPIYIIVIIIQNKNSFKIMFKLMLQFGVAILLIYGAWPARNYINYNKIVFTQDLRGAANWNLDVISFMQYIYSVKAEWAPQFFNIIHNKNVVFPSNAYLNNEDSIKLQRAVYLAKNCGSGFSHWKGYWKEQIEGENCNEEIKQIFDNLREKQIKANPFNFYILIPLKNLKKAVFKSCLNDNSSLTRKLASLLFYYRTLLLILGIK